MQSSKTSYQRNAKKIAEVKKRIDDAGIKEWNAIKGENPELEKLLGVKIQNICYKRRAAGFSKIVPAIMERLLWVGWERKTQKEILEDVKNEFLEHKIFPNIWHKEMTKWERKRVETLLECNGHRDLSIKGCKTLSDIKKKLVVARQKKGVARNIKAAVSIGKDMVVVGKISYPITQKKSGKHMYPSIRVTVKGKRVWQRVDVLRELLNG
jgi:hypothetical protein